MDTTNNQIVALNSTIQTPYKKKTRRNPPSSSPHPPDVMAAPATNYPTFTPSSAIHITKLNRQNYPLWRAQIVPYLKGQGVFGYVDSTITPPTPPAAANPDGQVDDGDNPLPAAQYAADLAAWTKTDNLILSTMASSLTDEVLMHVYTADTSAAMWSALSTSFASQSRAKLVQLRAELTSTRKDNSSATDYYFKIKNISDELSLAGHPISSDDFITYLLAGLGPEYDSLITMVSTREHISPDELYSLLLITESRLNRYRPMPPAVTTAPSTPVQALFTRGNQHNYASNQNPQQQPSFNSSRGRGLKKLQ